MAENVKALEAALDVVLEKLLAETKGSRSTLRFDDAARGWQVNFPVAEALRPGVKSLRGQGSINQRGAPTVKWMEKHRQNLYQPDLSKADPAPPRALIEVYGATAQMLGPIFDETGHLVAWISVHYVDGTHEFTDAHKAALDRAKAEVRRLTGLK
jgi:maleate isomerase